MLSTTRLDPGLALLGAPLAGKRAGLEGRPQDFFVGAGATSRERCRCKTQVRTIEIEADALLQLVHPLLCHARVGAAGTGLRARMTRIDAANQPLTLAAAHVGVSSKHLLGVHRVFSSDISSQRPRPPSVPRDLSVGSD